MFVMMITFPNLSINDDSYAVSRFQLKIAQVILKFHFLHVLLLASYVNKLNKMAFWEKIKKGVLDLNY
jgi:hypothetical protein